MAAMSVCDLFSLSRRTRIRFWNDSLHSSGMILRPVGSSITCVTSVMSASHGGFSRPTFCAIPRAYDGSVTLEYISWVRARILSTVPAWDPDPAVPAPSLDDVP